MMKNKSVQIDSAGYNRVQELAEQLGLTQAGSASLLVRAATPDRIRELVTEALERVVTTAPKPGTVGEGAPAPPAKDGVLKSAPAAGGAPAPPAQDSAGR